MSYPNKPAIIDYPISDLIKRRWSPRVFSSRLIGEEKIMSLFEAARWAPSSRNEQPWRFVYATRDDRENFTRIADLLVEGNSWAKKSALLIVVLARKNFTGNNKENYNAMYDSGAAAENLFLEAINQGLFAHEMIGFALEKALEVLAVPENFMPASLIAVGYPATLSDLEMFEPSLKERELSQRERLAIKQIISKGKFNF